MPPRLDPKFAAITAGIVAIIIYGSLYPFQFSIPPNAPNPIASLLATWRIPATRGDNLSNFLLYFPFGLFAYRMRRTLPWIAIVTLAGCALSVTMELAQFYDVGRESGLADVYANTAGTLAGAVASAMIRRPLRLPLIGEVEWDPFVFLLLAFWLGFEFFPPAPPVWQPYRQCVEWLMAGLLLESIVGMARARWILAIFLMWSIAFGTAGIGALFGALLWIVILSRLKMRVMILAALFVGYIVIQSLAPFHFDSTPHHFSWIPFRGFMAEQRGNAIRTFLGKAFAYGALVWILVRAGCRPSVATFSAAVLVLTLSIMQIYVPGRSAEITDCIMVLMLAGVRHLLPARTSMSPLQN